MKCPFCGNEMQSGYLQSGRPFVWSEGKKVGPVIRKTGPDVVVSEGFWVGCHARSEYCPDCKKIITSVPEKE